jgi:hypothetical protein
MKLPLITEHEPMPPALNMEAYLAFIEQMVAFGQADKMVGRKDLEERIEKRFCFPPDSDDE